MKWEFKDNHTFGKDYDGEEFMSVSAYERGSGTGGYIQRVSSLAQTCHLFNGVWRYR